MFSLIITIISIALVAALAIATIYYGGESLSRGGSRASADALINQAVQIAAAGHVAAAQGPGWPTGVSPAFSQPYLRAMPVPPKSAYLSSTTPTAGDWTYYLPGGASHHFVLKDKINREVCLAANKMHGFIGIPAVWDGKSITQCFGTGTAISGAYTFFYDPPGHTAAQELAALDQSRAEAGVTPSAPAGYPRLCPDGTTKATEADGVCADTVPGSGSTPPVDNGPPGPVYDLVRVYPDWVQEGGYGSSLDLCSSNAPAGVMTLGSIVKIDGEQGVVDSLFVQDGAQCLTVSSLPDRGYGTYPVTIKNTDRSTGSTTVPYLSYQASIQTLSIEYGRANVEKLITISGESFVPETILKVRNYENGSLGDSLVYILYPEFIDAQTLRFTLPVSTAVGVPTPGPGGYANISITAENPHAVPWTTNRTYQYLDPNGPIE